jgi:hypothetical protein
MTQDPVLELNYSTGLSARQLQHLLYVTKMEHLSENHHLRRSSERSKDFMRALRAHGEDCGIRTDLGSAILIAS